MININHEKRLYVALNFNNEVNNATNKSLK